MFKKTNGTFGAAKHVTKPLETELVKSNLIYMLLGLISQVFVHFRGQKTKDMSLEKIAKKKQWKGKKVKVFKKSHPLAVLTKP